MAAVFEATLLAATAINRATRPRWRSWLAYRRMLATCAFLRSVIQFAATPQSQEFDVTLTVAHITPLISLLAGVLILIVPALLNYIVAIYLIVAGVIGLNEIHHFLN